MKSAYKILCTLAGAVELVLPQTTLPRAEQIFAQRSWRQYVAITSGGNVLSFALPEGSQ